MYYYEAELVFKSYMPLKLEIGMWFISKNNNGVYLFELLEIPYDKDKFFFENGAPVNMYLIDVNDDNHIIATPEELGWLYQDTKELDCLLPLTLADVNFIIEEYEGKVEVEIIEDFFDDSEQIVPRYEEGKVCLKLIEEDEE